MVKQILFNTEMVRAVLDGRKTVTRRLVKPQPGEEIAYIWGGSNHGKWSFSPYNESRYEEHRTARDWKYWTPPYHADDILYVRETWAENPHPLDGAKYMYRASIHPADYDLYKWRPSIHMPREAARIWLRVTDVRVERLQEITMQDIRREGNVPSCAMCSFNEAKSANGIKCRQAIERSADCALENQFPDCGFRGLWDSTIKHADLDRYGWAANPWVWVIEFERCEKPEG